jgi:hypothetical protein
LDFAKMPFCLQYHNYERLGRLPMPVEEGDYRLFGDGRGQTLTTQEFVEKHLGSTVFLIVGIGKDPRRYYLWACFVIDKVTREGEIFTASGPGYMLNPPQLLVGEHFDEFKEQCAGFVTFSDISGLRFTKTLRQLAALFHRPNETDEKTRQFCKDLFRLLPDDSDAQDLLTSCDGNA